MSSDGYDPDTAHRFTYHPPTPEQPEVYQAMRDCAHLFVILVESATFPSRERSLALTKTEEAVMWANAAIARRGLSGAGIAGARDLVDHAIAQLQQAKPDSEWIEDDGTHWSPVTAWERAAKDAHKALAEGTSTEAFGILDAIVSAQPVEPDQDPIHLNDPWPPDGHVHPALEPQPAGYAPTALRSGLQLIAGHHHDTTVEGPGSCPGCIAQYVLNGDPIPSRTDDAADEDEAPCDPAYAMQKREGDEWITRSDVGCYQWAMDRLARAEAQWPKDAWRVHRVRDGSLVQP